jgi:hypothetical protein
MLFNELLDDFLHQVEAGRWLGTRSLGGLPFHLGTRRPAAETGLTGRGDETAVALTPAARPRRRPRARPARPEGQTAD